MANILISARVACVACGRTARMRAREGEEEVGKSELCAGHATSRARMHAAAGLKHHPLSARVRALARRDRRAPQRDFGGRGGRLLI